MPFPEALDYSTEAQDVLQKVRLQIACNVAVQGCFRELESSEKRSTLLEVAKNEVSKLGVTLPPKMAMLLTQPAEDAQQ